MTGNSTGRGGGGGVSEKEREREISAFCLFSFVYFLPVCPCALVYSSVFGSMCMVDVSKLC